MMLLNCSGKKSEVENRGYMKVNANIYGGYENNPIFLFTKIKVNMRQLCAKITKG